MIRTVIIRITFFLTLGLIAISCQEEEKQRIPMPTTDLSKASLIPKPLKTVPTNSAFALDQFTAIYTPKSATGFEEVAHF